MSADKDHLDDDENVKMMRDTAKRIGLTQLLIDISRSPAIMGGEDIERLCKALDLLGATDDEVQTAPGRTRARRRTR